MDLDKSGGKERRSFGSVVFKEVIQHEMEWLHQECGTSTANELTTSDIDIETDATGDI